MRDLQQCAQLLSSSAFSSNKESFDSTKVSDQLGQRTECNEMLLRETMPKKQEMRVYEELFFQRSYRQVISYFPVLSRYNNGVFAIRERGKECCPSARTEDLRVETLLIDTLEKKFTFR